jgi:hypothetical protein
MSLYVDPPFALGQTLGVSSASDGVSWVGVVKLFPDVNPITGRVRSSRLKKCIAVRNASGVTLFAKRGVSFAAGSYTDVVGYVYENGLANKQLAGVIDEHLPAAGVAANDVFWVTVEGPTEIINNVATQPGQHLIGATINSVTAATSAGNTGGYAITGDVTAALAAPTGRVVYYGRAASTASATAGCLVIMPGEAP